MNALGRAGALAVVLALAGGAAFVAWRRQGIGPVQRGFRAAEARGCFACHGPGGLRGFEDPTDVVGSVPAFTRETLESYARSQAEIREWILDGMPRRLREEAGSSPQEPPLLLRMPAFRGLLGGRELDDLVAYVEATADFHAPDEGPLAAGREVAARLGCFICHGPQGRGSLPNPGSFKGYIPAWDGPDLPELARDEGEVREWILDGMPRRLREHPIARFFLRRQKIQMPGYRDRMSAQDLEKLLGYIRHLRAAQPPRAADAAAWLPVD